jgi:hypothetical protein
MYDYVDPGLATWQKYGVRATWHRQSASDECFDDLRNNNGFGRNLTNVVSDEQCQTSEE